MQMGLSWSMYHWLFPAMARDWPVSRELLTSSSLYGIESNEENIIYYIATCIYVSYTTHANMYMYIYTCEVYVHVHVHVYMLNVYIYMYMYNGMYMYVRTCT